ncbi:MAG: phage major capsid protein [Clostridia bacterium]|nr:phage major capsid protein [Clostridia bacterium]
MVTLSSAENVLKDVYLGVIADQINTKTNPLFSRIKRSTRNIVGKEVRVVAPIGINGGIMAGEETSDLPDGVDTPYLSFVAPLKNLFGRFEISDKAIRCSSTDVNSFVNLLQDGMDSLLKASIFNLSRMIYGDGTGCLSTITVSGGTYAVDNVDAIAPGMYVDIYTGDTLKIANALVTNIDKSAKTFAISTTSGEAVATGDKVYLHNSKGNEIIGLKGIVNNSTLYGVDKSTYPIMNAKTYTATSSDAFDEDYVQKVIDDLEMTGTNVNFINCSYELKRIYQRYLTLYKKNIEYTTLEDGMKVLTHFGTPIVPTSQIGAGECYFLNTDDFMFYELGDWKWLEDESGRVLKQHANKAAYSATLVKYTELLCHKPSGVAFCQNVPTTIPESV